MKLDDLLPALFPAGHDAKVDSDGLIIGIGRYGKDKTATIVGIANQAPLGVEGALKLAGHVLQVLRDTPGQPIVVLVDTEGQRMTRRDEMLGLNEYLSHLAKCIILAGRQGHRTVGVLYGHAAAGAFITAALAPDMLVAIPGAEPVVMDIPSIARVTKLPQDKLEELAKSTPVFAPGLEYAVPIAAVAEVWDGGAESFAGRLEAVLNSKATPDRRDQVAKERKGRLKAADIAVRVQQEAGLRA